MRIDLHADTPLWQHWLGYDICRAHRPWLPGGALLGNLDLPRMQAAELDAQIFGLVALPVERDGFVTVQHMLQRLHSAVEKSAGGFALARSGSELRAARGQGCRVGMLSLEGVHSLRGQMARADWLIEQGVVSFGLAHFHQNAACSPAFGWGSGEGSAAGLTRFGHDLLAHLQVCGRVVDLAHINRRGFFEALAATRGPVWVSHTGVSGVHPHWRNIDDAQIRAVAGRGGLIGIIFARNYLGGGDMAAVVAHLRHLVQVGGSQCAALGSDFDGFIVPVRGLHDVTGLPALADALRRGGFTAAEVDGIMGDNALRFLDESLG